MLGTSGARAHTRAPHAVAVAALPGARHARLLAATQRLHVATVTAAPAPLSAAWYRRTTERQMMSKQYVTVRPITNGNGTIASGTPVRIRRKFDGLTLDCARCDCCGYSPTVSRVSPASIAELPA